MLHCACRQHGQPPKLVTSRASDSLCHPQPLVRVVCAVLRSHSALSLLRRSHTWDCRLSVPAALSRAQAQCLTEWYDSFAKPMGAEPSASQVHCALSAHWKGSLELMCPSGRKSVYAEAALRHAVRGDCAVGYRREDCGHRWAAHSAARNSKHARKRALNTPKPLCSTSALVDPCRKEHFSDRVLHRWMGSGHSCSAHAFCCWSTGTVAHACNAQHYSCLWDWAALLDQRWLDQHRTRTNAHVTICKRVCCAMELCTHCSYE